MPKKDILQYVVKQMNRKLTSDTVLITKYRFSSNFTKFYASVHYVFSYFLQDSAWYLIALIGFTCMQQISGKFSFRFYSIKMPYEPAIPLLGIHTEEIRIERDMCTSVHRSPVYNSQDMEATQMSSSRRMDKKAVVHIHNGVLLSH